jgi:cyclopropane fatty-acyl-phospholipid synthase-like methyltransferase
LTVTDLNADVLATYPRSAKHDLPWVMQHLMGPNVLWLTESLSQLLDLRPGMRVLDLGCGKAISSIFLAKEFGLQVWATDLWVDASENQARIDAAGLADSIFPIHAEAHSLPFAHGFFDAIVSMDAYHYFGTDDLYLGYIDRFLKPDGRLAIVSPGLTAEFGADVPAHLKPYWEWDFCSFHSPAWWRAHWEKTGRLMVEHADLQPDGHVLWLHWHELCKAHGQRHSEQEMAMLRADAGRTLGFTRLVGRKP